MNGKIKYITKEFKCTILLLDKEKILVVRDLYYKLITTNDYF